MLSYNDVGAEDQYDFDNDVSTLFKYVKSLKEIDRQIIIYRIHYNYTIQ